MPSEIALKSPQNMGTKYEQLIKKHPEVGKAILKGSWDFIGHSNKGTIQTLNPLWMKNIDQNVKNKLWRKCGSVRRDCIGLGKNKALIGVGAGQSFNKNKHVLKNITTLDGWKNWQDRDFIVIVSNHQFKPLLEMGIIPDFVILVDGSDVVYDQLLKDIPDEGQNTTLLAGLHCSPNVLKEWVNQKRELRFFLTTTKEVREEFKRITGKNPTGHVVLQGGNVLNTMLTLGLQVLNSKVFFAVANDLSYPIQKELEDQRVSYYADGDYSTNRAGTGTGRDEAAGKRKWMGFDIKSQMSLKYRDHNSYHIELGVVGTSRTLWVYKTWLETNMLLNSYKPENLQVKYYNCTEGGIAGVMVQNDNDKFMNDIGNWFLLDEVCRHWHTAKLEDAANQFLKAKEVMHQWARGETRYAVPSAIGLGQTI